VLNVTQYESGVPHIHAVKTFVDVWSIHIKIRICIFLDLLILIEQPPMSENYVNAALGNPNSHVGYVCHIFPLYWTLSYIYFAALFINISIIWFIFNLDLIEILLYIAMFSFWRYYYYDLIEIRLCLICVFRCLFNLVYKYDMIPIQSLSNFQTKRSTELIQTKPVSVVQFLFWKTVNRTNEDFIGSDIFLTKYRSVTSLLKIVVKSKNNNDLDNRKGRNIFGNLITNTNHLQDYLNMFIMCYENLQHWV